MTSGKSKTPPERVSKGQEQQRKTREVREQQERPAQRQGQTNQIVLWWNCAGGLAGKINEIKMIINDFSPIAFFIFESNIRNNKINSHLNIQGYELITTSTTFSRTACYLRSDSVSPGSICRGEGNEVITLEMGDMMIIGVYRPFKVEEGSNLNEQFDKLMKHLDQKISSAKSNNVRPVVAGDFNLDFNRIGDSSYSNSRLLNKLGIWAASHGLSQQIETETRHRLVKAQGGDRWEMAILDHLYSQEKESPEIFQCGTSDHLAIGLSIPLSLGESSETTKIVRRDWRKYNNPKHFNKVLDSETTKHLIDSAYGCFDVEELNNRIKAIHTHILDELAPYRVFRLRNDQQQLSSSVEALKKKRNRAYREFKKTGNKSYLEKSQDLTKDLKKLLNKTEKIKIQNKARAKDPKTFWNLVSELRNGKKRSEKIMIDTDDGPLTEGGPLADAFGNFFVNKVKKLSEQTERENIPQPVFSGAPTFEITPVDVALVSKTLKSKKSCGIDGVPLCVVKDTEPFLRILYCNLFNAVLKASMPEMWRLARVIPLHKKGNKNDINNYRPISNLCSISKLYEKVILMKINECGVDLDGTHQHGFKPKHSTTSAIVDIQKEISCRLEQGHDCVIYSVDLSAAFDMLRKRTFVSLLHPNITAQGLDRVLYDFLSDRKFIVEVNSSTSTEFNLEIGCVQGSVLGPKLFSLYTRLIPTKLPPAAHITTYADDSYVILSAPSGNLQSLVDDTNSCLQEHIEYLRKLGMVVNRSKTEIMVIPSNKSMVQDVAFGELKPLNQMKVLGVILDDSMSWSTHIATTINKLSRLTGAMKFLRRRLTKEQFMKVLTSQYYGSCYYASQAWLGPHTKKMDLRKLNSLHYKLLRVCVYDWKNKVSRSELDLLGRARPSLWAKYSTANFTIKVLRDRQPARLHDHIISTLFHERRFPDVYKFYDKSKKKIGRQALGNRLKDIFDEFQTPLTLRESNGTIRLKLKRAFNFPGYDNNRAVNDKPDEVNLYDESL